jgi:hypothetical protein
VRRRHLASRLSGDDRAYHAQAGERYVHLPNEASRRGDSCPPKEAWTITVVGDAVPVPAGQVPALRTGEVSSMLEAATATAIAKSDAALSPPSLRQP